MLKKQNRLTKKGSFNYVYKKGLRKSDRLISFVYISSHGLKIGFSVNNKIGKANVRNLLKRRMRAILREFIDTLKPVQGVFVVRVGAEQLSYEILRKSIIKLLTDSGVLKESDATKNIV